jgi:hypothetical protein
MIRNKLMYAKLRYFLLTLVLDRFLVWHSTVRPQYWSFYGFLQRPEATAPLLFPQIFLAPSITSLLFIIINWGYVQVWAKECGHRILRWKWLIKFYQEQKSILFIISVHERAMLDKKECSLYNGTAILLLQYLKITSLPDWNTRKLSGYRLENLLFKLIHSTQLANYYHHYCCCCCCSSSYLLCP